MAHGRFINMFRTFHNTGSGANLQIHTFLESLQQVLGQRIGVAGNFVFANGWRLGEHS